MCKAMGPGDKQPDFSLAETLSTGLRNKHGELACLQPDFEYAEDSDDERKDPRNAASLQSIARQPSVI